jgi:hypothetical protein
MSTGGFECTVERCDRELFEGLQGSPAFCSRGTLTLRFRRQLEVPDLHDINEAELMILVTTANQNKVVPEITLMVSPEQCEEATKDAKICSMYALTLNESLARDIVREAGFDDSQRITDIAFQISSALHFSFSSGSKYQISQNDRDNVRVERSLDEGVAEGCVHVPLRFPPAAPNAPEGRAILRFRLVQDRMSLRAFHILSEVAFRVPGESLTRPMELVTGSIKGKDKRKAKFDDGGTPALDSPHGNRKGLNSQGTEGGNKKLRKNGRGSGIIL